MNIQTSIAALAFAMAGTAHAADRPAPVTQSFIRRLVSEAMSKHPKMGAAQARAQAAASAVHAIRLWDDPEIGLGATLASRTYRKGNGDIALGVSQKLPRRGLYEAEKRKAAAGQQAQDAELRMTANGLGLAVAQAALELALADDALVLQEQELSWLDAIVRTTTERAQNPASSAVEPLRVQSELALQTQKREAAKRQRAQMARALNLLLRRNAEASWPALTLPGRDTSVDDKPSLDGSPRLSSLRHQVDASRAETDAAKEKRKPVLSFGVDTNTYSRGGFVDAMVSVKVSLPWFNDHAYKADIARAEHLRSAAENDLAAESRELATQLSSLRTEAENNRRLDEAYQNDVLPKTEKTVEAIQNAWISSKATLLEVFESRRSLLEARQEQKRAIAARNAALSSIAALTGGFATPDTQKP